MFVGAGRAEAFRVAVKLSRNQAVMKQIPVSQFKANCSALIEQVRKTKRSIQITRHGKVIAEITPVASEKSRGWLGRMKGTAEIVGDIVSPVIDLEDIEALKG
jgi:prevent-host-death family protein